VNLSLLVTGARGQLGRDVATRIHAPGSAELDITDPAAVSNAISLAGRGSRLVVVNAAAYTAVDAAEREGAARSHAVNAQGPANLASACAAHQAHLVHVSTDYVFAGDSAGPNQVDGRTAPRTGYGRTKLAGERAVLSSGASAHVVRTAWLYGAHGGNFVRTMARMARGSDPVRVVDDQHGNPTWTADLADGLIALALAADRVPCCTVSTPAPRPGSGWPGRCSPRPVPIRTGCGRAAPPTTPAPPSAQRTRCWTPPAGPKPAYPSYATGEPQYTPPSPPGCTPADVLSVVNSTLPTFLSTERSVLSSSRHRPERCQRRRLFQCIADRAGR